MSKVVDGGISTAYGAAVRGGYQGTYTEFCAALGQLAEVLEDFEDFSVTVTTLAEGSQATASYADGVLSLGIPKGDTGNGIASATLNQDYTLTLTWTNGQSITVGPIRGEVGATPHMTIGTVQTLEPESSATATITGTDENPVLNLGIPKGDPGQDGASDAGAVTFDPEDDYNDGTVGKVLKDELNALSALDDRVDVLEPTATASDVGKALIAKTVSNGVVTEYEFGVAGGGGGMNVVTLSGTTITQTGADNTFYICGELATLDFTAPSVGITGIRFDSGTTPTVLTISGVTAWMFDFDPTSLEASTTYEINVLNGIGVAGWV